MPQVTLRLPDELAAALKQAAAARGQSVNGFAAEVLGAAVDPEHAASETERIRERLRRAGILAEFEPLDIERPSEEELAEARAALGGGEPLVSDLVSEGRGPVQ